MDATQANVGISREAFLHNLAATRLLTDVEINQLSAAHSNSDAISLVHALATAGSLTAYQLDAVCQENTSALRIGNYDILDKLGAGGMGTVFKARHRRMKRVVALKVLLANYCQDDSFVQRFHREVVTIARLQHPNVVMAFDADEAEIGHFLVMEFVDGRDLQSTVAAGGPLSIARAINYTIQAARGLAYAHSQQIIHRDIKPANLMLDSSGTVKVADMGLARLASSGGDSSATGLTQAGGILGTVDYMAPEQAIDSTAVDHRADIYSLGCTLYFLLTGKPLYFGASAMSVLVKHREGPVPSLLDAHDATPEFNAIFAKMVAKTVEQRYATMAEVIGALETVANKVHGATVPPIFATPIPSSTVSLDRPDKKTITALPAEAAPSVFVVEPSRMQAGVVRKYLELHGMTVAGVAKTGSEALATILAAKPNAVISALHLDDMSGLELAKQVCAATSDRTLGFVLVSSEADQSESESLSRLDRSVLLAKPFTADQLQQALSLVTGNGMAGSTDFSFAPTVDRATLRVLVVDDSAVARSHERNVLRSLGFDNFVDAVDGAQAIAATTREKFDLIVTDYNMPLMDGYALITYLRQTPNTAKVPIIMVTTETSPKVLERVRQLGVAAIYEKTFPVDEVRSIVDRLF